MEVLVAVAVLFLAREEMATHQMLLPMAGMVRHRIHSRAEMVAMEQVAQQELILPLVAVVDRTPPREQEETEHPLQRLLAVMVATEQRQLFLALLCLTLAVVAALAGMVVRVVRAVRAVAVMEISEALGRQLQEVQIQVVAAAVQPVLGRLAQQVARVS